MFIESHKRSLESLAEDDLKPFKSNKINLKVNIMINYRTLKKQGKPLQLKEIIPPIKKKSGLIKVYVKF